jgi:hypothetical protein
MVCEGKVHAVTLPPASAAPFHRLVCAVKQASAVAVTRLGRPLVLLGLESGCIEGVALSAPAPSTGAAGASAATTGAGAGLTVLTLRGGHHSRVLGMSVHPSRPALVSYDEGSVAVWSYATGQLLRTMAGGPVAASFTADGGALAVALRGGSLSVWPYAREGACLYDIKMPRLKGDPDDAFSAFAFSPDGHYLVGAGATGCLGVWNAETGAEIRAIILPDDTAVASLTFVDGQSRCCVLNRRGRAWVVDVDRARVAFEITSAAAISPDEVSDGDGSSLTGRPLASLCVGARGILAGTLAGGPVFLTTLGSVESRWAEEFERRHPRVAPFSHGHTTTAASALATALDAARATRQEKRAQKELFDRVIPNPVSEDDGHQVRPRGDGRGQRMAVQGHVDQATSHAKRHADGARAPQSPHRRPRGNQDSHLHAAEEEGSDDEGDGITRPVLAALLDNHGCYPSEYRLLCWRKSLGIGSRAAKLYSDKVALGLHEATVMKGSLASTGKIPTAVFRN